MITIEAKNGKAVLYDSIRELPIKRYNAFNRYLIQDSGIGSDLPSIHARFERFDLFLNAQRLQELAQERQNLHFTFHAILNLINFKSRAFACLCYSIDGEKIEDIENDLELEKALSLLEKIEVTQWDVEEALTDIRKKWIVS